MAARSPKLPEPTADPDVVGALVERLDKLADELADLYHHAADLIGVEERRTGNPALAYYPAAHDETRRWTDLLRERYGLPAGEPWDLIISV